MFYVKLYHFNLMTPLFSVPVYFLFSNDCKVKAIAEPGDSFFTGKQL